MSSIILLEQPKVVLIESFRKFLSGAVIYVLRVIQGPDGVGRMTPALD